MKEELIVELDVNMSVSELLDFWLNSTSDCQTFTDSEETRSWACKLENNAFFTVCRNSKRKIVGLLASYTNNPPTCYNTHVRVVSDYDIDVVFSLMFLFLEDYLIEHGFDTFKIQVAKNQHDAISTYKKNGLHIIGESSEDAWYMEKCF